MTPLLLAREIRAIENVLMDARETQMYSKHWGELVDKQNTLLEQDGAAIAEAFIRATEILTRCAEAMEASYATFDGRLNSTAREARAFLKEQDNG